MPATAIKDRRAIDLEPVFTRSGKLHLMAKHLAATGEHIDQLSELMEPQSL